MVKNGNKFSETFKHGRIRMCKRADSGIWYAVFKHPLTGKYPERSTGTTRKKEAVEEAEELLDQIRNHRFGIADGSIPLRTLFEKFLEEATDHLKAKSAKRLRATITMFQDWLQESNLPVGKTSEVTPEIVRKFQRYRVQTGKVAKRTANNDVTNLHTIFSWAVREKLLAESPTDYSKKSGRVRLYKVTNGDPDTYSEEEYRKLVGAAEARGDILIHDMIIVFAGTGMRFQELSHLEPTSLIWEAERPLVEVRARGDWSPKQHDEVKLIPMLPEVQEVLRRRCEESSGGYLFTNRAGNLIADNKTRERLKRLFPAVGIGEERRLHWHSLRCYFVKRCVLSGIPLNAIMAWTGHDTVEMCLHYARTTQADQFTEFGKLLKSEENMGNEKKRTPPSP